MKHYTILGCADVIVSMLFGIIADNHDSQISVDIVKNVKLVGSRYPYKTNSIVSREIDVDNWGIGGETEYLLGVINPLTKQIVSEYFSKHFSVSDNEYTILIHKHASIAPTVDIENGVVISPGVVIAPYTKLERYVTVSRNVSLGHHTTIGEFTQINPAANIAGHCSIGKKAFIGMGAIIIDKIKVGNNTIIGAGSLVTKNIPDNVIAYGNPAKVIRNRT